MKSKNKYFCKTPTLILNARYSVTVTRLSVLLVDIIHSLPNVKAV